MAHGPTRGIPIDTDGTLAGNSDQLVASQKAVKTYVDGQNHNDLNNLDSGNYLHLIPNDLSRLKSSSRLYLFYNAWGGL